MGTWALKTCRRERRCATKVPLRSNTERQTCTSPPRSDRPETTARVLDRLEQSSGRVACRFLLANLRRANKRFLLADFSRLYFRFCDAIGAWQNQSALRYTPFVLIIHQLMGNIRIFFLNCVGFVVVENSSHIYTTFIVVYMHIMARPSFETITKTV
jgi:hypothetical protein